MSNVQSHPMPRLLLELAEATKLPYLEILNSALTCAQLETFSPANYIAVMRDYERKLLDFDRFFPLRSLTAALKESVDSVGFSFNDLHVTVFNKGEEARMQSGRCFDIDPPHDVRVLVNLWKDGLQSYRIMFHEFGHALHFKYLNPELPPLLRQSMADSLTEAMAQVFEAILFDQKWLLKFTSMTPEDAAQLRHVAMTFELLKFRRDIAFALFEYELYQERRSDLKELSDEIYREILLTKVEADLATSNLARWQQFVSHSLSAVNWMFCLLIREQVKNFAASHTKSLYHAALGEKLIPIYELGGALEWSEILERVTGESSTFKHLVSSFFEILRLKPLTEETE